MLGWEVSSRSPINKIDLLSYAFGMTSFPAGGRMDVICAFGVTKACIFISCSGEKICDSVGEDSSSCSSSTVHN